MVINICLMIFTHHGFVSDILQNKKIINDILQGVHKTAKSVSERRKKRRRIYTYEKIPDTRRYATV